jgi:hypothetical protein
VNERAGDAVPGGATVDDTNGVDRQSRDTAESTARAGAVVEGGRVTQVSTEIKDDTLSSQAST